MSSLENLVRVGQLKMEPPSDDEIATSLRKAALYLADAALPSLSPPSRFMLAYDAAHALAFAALSARPLRLCQTQTCGPSCLVPHQHSSSAKAAISCPVTSSGV